MLTADGLFVRAEIVDLLLAAGADPDNGLVLGPYGTVGACLSCEVLWPGWSSPSQ